jgi:hypothetical protein
VKAHQGGFIPYAREAWGYWVFLANEWLVWDVFEAFCTMLIGVALWKWGVIQGQRSKRFYLVLMLAAYGFGVTARAIGVSESIQLHANAAHELGDRRVRPAGGGARAPRAGELGGADPGRQRAAIGIQGAGADGLLALLPPAVRGEIYPVRALGVQPYGGVTAGRRWR